MRGSLRTTLLVSTTLATAAVLAAAGAVLYALVRDGLVDQFDRALLDKAQLLASAVEQEHGTIDVEFDELDMREFQRAEHPGYLALWQANGAALFRSASSGAADLDGFRPPGGEPAFREATLPGGGAARAVAIRFTPRTDEDEPHEAEGDDSGRGAPTPGPALTLVLARETASVDTALGRFRATLVAVGLLAMGVSAGLLWVLVRRGLRPVEGVAGQIAGLGEQDLAARVEARDAPRELGPVVDRLNELLGRLEAAFVRERRFGADVAHELRTPLAGLRSTMEVTLACPRSGPAYEASLQDSLRIAVRMQTMVEQLLALARLDAGQADVCPETVSPNRVIHDAWKPLAQQADARGLRVAWRLAEDGQMVTDPALLGLVVRNVLENAVVHAEEGGAATVETDVRPEALSVRVTNSGSRLPQAQADHVFERFWRGDAARTDAGVHCGLGLPLVKLATERLGGTVEVRSTAGGTFRITVSIPRTPPSG